MSNIDFDEIIAEEEEKTKTPVEVDNKEEKKPFKPDLRLWVPFGVVVGILAIFCIYILYIA